MRENVSGTVILYAIIHADGTVGNVRVLRGVDERLDQFASQAIAQWQFQPAMKNGSPVDVEATFQIPFRPARVGRTSSVETNMARSCGRDSLHLKSRLREDVGEVASCVSTDGFGGNEPAASTTATYRPRPCAFPAPRRSQGRCRLRSTSAPSSPSPKSPRDQCAECGSRARQSCGRCRDPRARWR